VAEWVLSYRSGRAVNVPFVDLARQHGPIAGELRAAFERVLASGRFVLGAELEQFESEFAAYCQSSHCVGVGSGTAALILLLRAAGVDRGDEVIVPAHTFVATALAVMHAGAIPVCVDVEPATGLIDIDAVRAAIGPRTAAIIAVHLYGGMCRMDELGALAAKAGLALFEDAAQAHGATLDQRRAGSLGRAAAFSFYPSKNLGALGDGGAICTDDPELAASARRLRDLGRQDGSHVVAVAGFNERLDPLQAAFLRVKLKHLDRWNRARRLAAAAYCERLAPFVELTAATPRSEPVHHLFAIRVHDRNRVAERLRAAGVETGVHYPVALADQPSLQTLASADVPVARDWAARELSLPMFVGISGKELKLVGDAVEKLAAAGLLARAANAGATSAPPSRQPPRARP
jgi:dTDP-4-amino-4,6-dideoxygalactose transaminase